MIERTTDSELVRRSRGGDARAFGALYDRLAPDVARYVTGLRLGLRGLELEDAVQETFLRVLKGLQGSSRTAFDAKRPLRPFVLGVARRVGLELCRKRRASGLALEIADPGPGADGQAERAEQTALVGAALAVLPDEQRTLLALRHVSQLSMQELADGLGCSLPTARARLREAKVGFARQLRARGVTPGGRS